MICIVYVDDCLLFSENTIEIAVQRLQDAEFDLIIEEDVAGFLGISSANNSSKERWKLSQCDSKHCKCARLRLNKQIKCIEEREKIEITKSREVSDCQHESIALLNELSL